MAITNQNGPFDRQAATVDAADDVKEVPSKLVAEAQMRHEHAQSDYATPQEKRQAAVELAAANDARPDGSFAQLHETEVPRKAVADEGEVKQMKEDLKDAQDKLEGSAPAGSPAAVKAEEEAAKARRDAGQAPGETTQPTETTDARSADTETARKSTTPKNKS